MNVDLELLKDYVEVFEKKVSYIDLADALQKLNTFEGIDSELKGMIEKINICGIGDNMNVGIFLDDKPLVLFLKENDESAYKNIVNIVKVTSRDVKEDEGCVIV